METENRLINWKSLGVTLISTEGRNQKRKNRSVQGGFSFGANSHAVDNGLALPYN